MKKTLVSIILTGCLALNGNAMGKTSAQELYKNILKTEPQTTSDSEFVKTYSSKRNIQSNKGYVLEITANTINDPKGEGEKNLSFKISDETTNFYIFDTNSDGFNNDDMISINHNFKNGDGLFAGLITRNDGNYEIAINLFDSNHKSYASTFVSTKNLNLFEKILVDRKSKPILNWGSKLYKNIVESSYENKDAIIPYENFKKALDEVEKILPLIKEGKEEANTALTKLAESYISIIKQKK